ncbi:dicarboxylate transport 2.1 [Actinidia rufa]|uniref:Dicarboxylate transport 2.1 n=1 Tax=Actinidia rufa TaxID=165716 RepID=A0A7J0EUJ3_9ERIC|nr:dicarboxylate transport 2.1 [Actinidia rufa]
MESYALHSPSFTTFFSHSSRLSFHLRHCPHLPKSPPSISLRPPPGLRPASSSLSSNSFSLLTPKPLLFTLLPKPTITQKPIRSSACENIEPATKSKPQGAKILPFVITVSIGLIVRFFVPKPPEVSAQSWQLLAIFLSTVAGLVLNPLPGGACAFLGLTTTIVTKTLPFSTVFEAFTSEVIWLIVISFFFARGFVKTGLGDRIATYFVKWLGKSTLGLSYGLTVSEALIALVMPSTTARAGGLFLPIIQSISLAAGSKPGDPSAKKLGAYLVQSQFQMDRTAYLKDRTGNQLIELMNSLYKSISKSNLCFNWKLMRAAGNSSALFLTAAAVNLLCLKLSEELGVSYTNFIPRKSKDTPDAPAMATRKLEQMGPVTRNEWAMVGTMLLAVSLWVFGDALGIASVVTAMLGLSILLLLGVLDWEDCLTEKSAWDTLAWLAVLVGMAGQLTNLGILTWMFGCVAKFLQSLSLSWPAAFAVLQAAYFLIHYVFASQAGHVGALFSAFLAMHLASGVPGVLAVLALAYNTNLFGAITHYSSGQAAIYTMELVTWTFPMYSEWAL